MKGITVFVIACAVVSGASAIADSDRYFCTGEGYLAYETRWVGEARNHILQIVRFGEAIGLQEVEPVVLNEFQTHGMSCGKDYISLNSGSGPPHYVDITDIEHPTVVTDDKPYHVSTAGHLHRGNLGHWSDESVVDLSADGRFQLVMLKIAHPARGGIEHYSISELIEREPRRRIVRSLILFTGIFLETID